MDKPCSSAMFYEAGIGTRKETVQLIKSINTNDFP